MWQRSRRFLVCLAIPMFVLFLASSAMQQQAMAWVVCDPGQQPPGIVLTWPLRGDVVAGWTLDCARGTGHRGIDIAARDGETIDAAAAGRVSFTGYTPAEGGGLTLTIDHPGGLRSTYLHLGSITVSTGDMVDAGGKVGTSDGRPLHLGLKIPGGTDIYFDPTLLLPPVAASPPAAEAAVAPGAVPSPPIAAAPAIADGGVPLSSAVSVEAAATGAATGNIYAVPRSAETTAMTESVLHPSPLPVQRGALPPASMSPGPGASAPIPAVLHHLSGRLYRQTPDDPAVLAPEDSARTLQNLEPDRGSARHRFKALPVFACSTLLLLSFAAGTMLTRDSDSCRRAEHARPTAA